MPVIQNLGFFRRQFSEPRFNPATPLKKLGFLLVVHPAIPPFDQFFGNFVANRLIFRFKLNNFIEY